MRLSSGARFGTYEILAPIGAGGMGEVYRARDTRLKRDVAVKVLPGTWVDTADRRARFEREAELLGALNHSNIAAIYGVEESGGTTALILELVEGQTLAERLAAGPIRIREALPIARQIVDALDAAHDKGIVHRDLKPANIKVRDDGTVKVLDFGLAKALDVDPEVQPVAVSPTMTSPAMTSMGVILGTAAYMSPEQARGQIVDKRTDIWAFGCVLYEMLTGRIAFARDTVPDTVAAVLEREPDLSALPDATPPMLRRLLRRCFEKNRSRRLRDIGDARHVLDDLEEDGGGGAAPSPSRGRLQLVAGVAIGASIVAGSAALLMRRNSQALADAPSLSAQFRRLTSDAAYSIEPALSRDGTMVAYASDRGGDGQLDLWLQRTAGDQPIQLTNESAADRQPDFSPDGRFIAFRSERVPVGIYVMPTLGGNARLVAEGGRRPRFSPDGTRIAYWSGRWLSAQGARAPGNEVFTVPAHGGPPSRIADGFATARDPVWAPDGQSLLFFGRKTTDDSATGSFDWWWAPLDGRQPVPTGAYRVLIDRGFSLLEDVEGGILMALEALPATWTRSGVIFSSGYGESVNLWRLDVSPRTGQVVPASLERLTSGAGFDRTASADDSGRTAFQVSSEGLVSLTLPLDSNAGRGTGTIARHTFWAAQFTNRSSLDHAARLLAFVRSRGNESEIWVKDLLTAQERHLVTTRLTRLDPQISPDGTQVTYTVLDGVRRIGYVVPTGGGAPRQVCDDCALRGWFTDNRRVLALDAVSPSRRVRMIDIVERTGKDLLTHPKSVFSRADISPDSRWVAFSSQGRVWVAPVRPGNPPQEGEWVSILSLAADSPERACGWSPDGRLLYLLLERDGFRDLYAQRIDPARGTAVGEPFIVQHLHDPRRRWGTAPHGTAIVSNAFVFTQIEMTGSIWLLEPDPARGRGQRAP